MDNITNKRKNSQAIQLAVLKIEERKLSGMAKTSPE